MAVKRLIDGRFQFIRVVSTKAYTKTYLMTDHDDAAQAKCIVKHLELPAHNVTTRKFLSDLLAKRVNLLKRIEPHSAIAQQLATVQDGPNFYWVRSYIAGQPLSSELIEGKPRSEAEVRQFLLDSLGTLELIQRHGIAHQNLHPNNLIRNAEGHLVLVDFGLIQDLGTADLNGATNGDLASPRVESAYLPQGQSRQYSRFAADHFALGMAAVQMATGLSNEAMPRLSQADFWDQLKLQLDECSTLERGLKNILLTMVSPQPDNQWPLAKDILVALSSTEASSTEASSAEVSGQSSSAAAARDRHGVAKAVPQTDAAAHWPRSQVFSQPKVWLGVGAALGLLAWGGLTLRPRPQVQAVKTLLQQAETANQLGHKNDSLNYLNQVLDLSPDHGPALAQRSSLFWENGQAEEALQDLTNAIEASSEDAALYYQRGNFRLLLGDLQGAIQDYSAAIEHRDNYVDAHINRGNARAELGDEAGALQDYTAAVNLAADAESKADAYLNRCLSHSNLNDHAAALSDCAAAVNLRPNNSYAYENRGLVKRRLNDFQGAIQDFTIAIQIDASSPEPYYNRGLTRLNLGDFAGAMADFNQTIELNPKHPFAYYDRGLLHAELGDLDSAIADLETVASACLDVSRLGCFDDAQYQLTRLRAVQQSEL